MVDDIGLSSFCFDFRENQRSASQYVIYGPLTIIDESLSLHPNRSYHPLITQRKLDFKLKYRNLVKSHEIKCENK